MVSARQFGAMINLELTIMTSISNVINRLRLLPALLRGALRGLFHARFGVEQCGPLGVCVGQIVLRRNQEDATRPGVRCGEGWRTKEQRTEGCEKKSDNRMSFTVRD